MTTMTMTTAGAAGGPARHPVPAVPAPAARAVTAPAVPPAGNRGISGEAA